MLKISFNMYKHLGVKDPKNLPAPEPGIQDRRLAPRFARNFNLNITSITAPQRDPVKIRTPPRGRRVVPAPAQAPAPAPAIQVPAPATEYVELKETASLSDEKFKLATTLHAEQYRDAKIALAEEASVTAHKAFQELTELPQNNSNNSGAPGRAVPKNVEMAMDHADLVINANDSASEINLISAMLQAAKGIHSDADLPAETIERRRNRADALNLHHIEAQDLLQTINGFSDFDQNFAHFTKREKDILTLLKPDPATIHEQFNWNSPIGKQQFVRHANGQDIPIADVRIKLLLQLIGLRYDMNIKLDILDVDTNRNTLKRRLPVIADQIVVVGQNRQPVDDESKYVNLTLLNTPTDRAPRFNLLTKSERARNYNPELSPDKRIYWKSYTGRVKAVLADLCNSTRRKARDASITELEQRCEETGLTGKQRNTYKREKNKRENLHSSKKGFHNPVYTLARTLLGKRKYDEIGQGESAERVPHFSTLTPSEFEGFRRREYDKMRGYEKRNFERAAIVLTAQAELDTLKIPTVPLPKIIATHEMLNEIDRTFKATFACCEQLEEPHKSPVLHFVRNAFVAYDEAVRLGDIEKCIASIADCKNAIKAFPEVPANRRTQIQMPVVKKAIETTIESINAITSKPEELDIDEELKSAIAAELKFKNLERCIKICYPESERGSEKLQIFQAAFQYAQRPDVKVSVKIYDLLTSDRFTMEENSPMVSSTPQSRIDRFNKLTRPVREFVKIITKQETKIENLKREIENVRAEAIRAEGNLQQTESRFTWSPAELVVGLITRFGRTLFAYDNPDPIEVNRANAIAAARTSVLHAQKKVANLSAELTKKTEELHLLKKFYNNGSPPANPADLYEMRSAVIKSLESIEKRFNQDDQSDITVEKLVTAKWAIDDNFVFDDLKTKLNGIQAPLAN